MPRRRCGRHVGDMCTDGLGASFTGVGTCISCLIQSVQNELTESECPDLTQIRYANKVHVPADKVHGYCEHIRYTYCTHNVHTYCTHIR